METENILNPNLLNRLEIISAAASSCNLNFQNLTAVSDDIREVSTFLGITTEQAVIFSCLSELSFQKTVTVDNLAKHFKCTVIKIISFMNELEVLEKRNYIKKCIRQRGRTSSFHDIGYSVPYNVIEAILKADPGILETSKKFDLPTFLKQVSDMVEERRGIMISTNDLIKEVEFLISNNLDIPYVSFVNNSLAQTISKCFVFKLSYCRLSRQYNMSNDYFTEGIFDDFGEQLEFENQVANGNHEVIQKEILKLDLSEFDGDKMIALSDKTAKLLYDAYPALLNNPDNSGLISAKLLTEKKLFFNAGVREQLGALEEVLKPARFKTYRKELKRNRMKESITAIFFGEPGTGKTEAVYQLARKTGRDIMMVDMSETKSKWYGESEKIVKKIFNDYASMLKSNLVEPILFINEADGLFARRLDLSNSRGTSTDQTNNTIQNILLQSLETFEGILLATSNLTENLDKAFERRFSFRISFPKPDARARQSIWKNKLPELSGRNAAILAEKFDISGGEIDVQVKQVILRKVIKRKVELFDLLVESCSKNHGFTSRRRVGF